MLSYELTPDADKDLEDIARYTTLEWGPEQATLYIDKLHQGFHEIATKQVMRKTFYNVSRRYSSHAVNIIMSFTSNLKKPNPSL